MMRYPLQVVSASVPNYSTMKAASHSSTGRLIGVVTATRAPWIVDPTKTTAATPPATEAPVEALSRVEAIRQLRERRPQADSLRS
ncbi:hypothetical protein ACWPKO_30480 (plasmid) [Coraliomargarita sp. W4R53]